MGNTEIFELCETSSKKRCPDCALYWETGIVYWSCGRCLIPSQSTKKLDKKNYDALSIPGYVILTRGAKHGASERQRMLLQSQGDVAESSPTQTWWVQNHIGKMAQWWQMTASLCQKLGGLENRLFSMTNLHWKITPTLQQEEKEIVMRKVGYSSWIKKVLKDQWINDLISWKQNEKWKDCMMNMWKRLQREIHPFILYNDQDNQDTNNLKDLKIIIKSMPKQDGGPILRSHRETCRGIQHIRPRQLSGNSTTIGNRTKVGILGDPHPGLNSSDFFSSEMPFSLAGNWIPWQSTGGVDRYTCRTPHFHMYCHSTNHTAQMSCVRGSSLSCAPK